jgi:hypothetical protein
MVWIWSGVLELPVHGRQTTAPRPPGMVPPRSPTWRRDSGVADKPARGPLWRSSSFPSRRTAEAAEAVSAHGLVYDKWPMRVRVPKW